MWKDKEEEAGAESDGGPTFIFRLGLQQLQLLRGPHRILLTSQELTFLQQTPSQRVSGQTWAG